MRPQQAVQDSGDDEGTDSEDELEGIDLDKGNDGVQKNIARLFKILVKDRRKEVEHRSEVRCCAARSLNRRSAALWCSHA